jgi:hypothetical protein
LAHRLFIREKRRGPFDFAQGRLFDSGVRPCDFAQGRLSLRMTGAKICMIPAHARAPFDCAQDRLRATQPIVDFG